MNFGNVRYNYWFLFISPLISSEGFHRFPGVGGACGECVIDCCLAARTLTSFLSRICVDAGKSFSLLLTNPLVAAQNFEVGLLAVFTKSQR